MNNKWSRLTTTAMLMASIFCASGGYAQETIQLTFRQFDPPTEIDGLVNSSDCPTITPTPSSV